MFIEDSVFTTFGILMGQLGSDILVANQIAFNVVAFFFVIPLGISSAVTIRVGYAIGSEKYSQARFVGFPGIIFSWFVMLFIAVSVVVFNKEIATLYSDNEKVIFLAAIFLHIAALSQFSDGLQAVANGALRGARDTLIPFLTVLVAYWLIGIPVGYYSTFYLHIGPVRLWYDFVAGMTTAAIFLVGRSYFLMNKFS